MNTDERAADTAKRLAGACGMERTTQAERVIASAIREAVEAERAEWQSVVRANAEKGFILAIAPTPEEFAQKQPKVIQRRNPNV